MHNTNIVCCIFLPPYSFPYGQSLGRHAVLKPLDESFVKKLQPSEASLLARILRILTGSSQKSRPPSYKERIQIKHGYYHSANAPFVKKFRQKAFSLLLAFYQ